MTNTLCIETSGAHCSLALTVQGEIYAINRQLQRSHNQHLLNLLVALFSQAAVTPTQLDLVAFGCGPGSFTGVRIAAAACQAVALAADVPVVSIPSSLALALSARSAMQNAASESAAHTYVCSIKSRGEAYYLSTFEDEPGHPGGLLQTRDDQLVDGPPEWLVGNAAPAGWVGVGEQPGWWPQQRQCHWLTEVFPNAADCLQWAAQQHTAGAALAPEQALPRYIAGDSPWKKSAAG
jgi:tRNA threonylcarbamoyladenosine biosynthesis protein TsaB